MQANEFTCRCDLEYGPGVIAAAVRSRAKEIAPVILHLPGRVSAGETRVGKAVTKVLEDLEGTVQSQFVHLAATVSSRVCAAIKISIATLHGRENWNAAVSAIR
jgi:hypothetical protein